MRKMGNPLSGLMGAFGIVALIACTQNMDAREAGEPSAQSDLVPSDIANCILEQTGDGKIDARIAVEPLPEEPEGRVVLTNSKGKAVDPRGNVVGSFSVVSAGASSKPPECVVTTQTGEQQTYGAILRRGDMASLDL